MSYNRGKNDLKIGLRRGLTSQQSRNNNPNYIKNRNKKNRK